MTHHCSNLKPMLTADSCKTQDTYLSQLSLWQLKLYPPARFLLLHTALETLQDTLLLKQQEWPLSLASVVTMEHHRITAKPSSHRLCQNLLVRLTVFLENPLGFLCFFQLLSKCLSRKMESLQLVQYKKLLIFKCPLLFTWESPDAGLGCSAEISATAFSKLWSQSLWF